MVAADGINSRLRDGLGLARRRRAMPDGAIRALVPYVTGEEAAVDVQPHHRILVGPAPRAVHPVQRRPALRGAHHARPRSAWRRRCRWTSPPGRAPSRISPALFPRIGADARYDRFGYVSLKSLVLRPRRGDRRRRARLAAEHRPGRGLLDDERALACRPSRAHPRHRPKPSRVWERTRTPAHATHAARLGVPGVADDLARLRCAALFFGLAGRSRVLTEMRTRTARHVPTGTLAHDNP